MQKIAAVLLVLGLFLTGCQQGNDVLVGPNWEAVRNLKPGAQAFRVEANGKESLQLGDELRYTVTASRAGKLWLLQVDSKDEVSVLYPNEQAVDNTIQANRPLSIPPAGADWVLEASEPLGKNLLAFIVITGDGDLASVLGQSQDVGKALRIVENSPAWGMTTKVIEVRGAKP